MYKPDCFATCDWPSLIELTNLLEAIRVLQELNFIASASRRICHHDLGYRAKPEEHFGGAAMAQW